MRKALKKTVIFLFIVITIMACALNQNLGNLIVNTTPMPVELMGEVDHTWQANLQPEKMYNVVVKNTSLNHSLIQVSVVITDDEYNNILTDVEKTPNEIKGVFITPSNGHINIRLFSLIGELQEELGGVSIQLLSE